MTDDERAELDCAEDETDALDETAALEETAELETAELDTAPAVEDDDGAAGST